MASTQEASGAAGVFHVTNDGPLMRRVCEELAKAASHVLLESEVKVMLGFCKKARPAPRQLSSSKSSRIRAI